MRTWVIVVLGVTAFSCAARSRQAEVAHRIVESLRETGNSPVCTPSAPNAPRVQMDNEWLEEMFDGVFDFPDSTSAVTPWKRCMSALLEVATASEQRTASATLVSALMPVFESRRRREHRAGLDALRDTFLQTRAGRGLASRSQPALIAFKERVDKQDDPRLRKSYRLWINALELARGEFAGEAITQRTIARTENEPMLLRFERLLPSEPLRVVARRRVVLLRITRGNYPELLSRAEAVIDAVLRRGRFEPPLSDFPVQEIQLGSGAMPRRFALHPAEGFRHYTLSPMLNDEVWSEGPLALGSQIQLELEGLAEPIRLCAPQKPLDPTPCLSATRLRSTRGEWTGLDYHPAPNLSMEDALDLALGGALEIRFQIGDRTHSLGKTEIAIGAPPPLRFSAGLGERGPDITVEIARPDDTFYLVQAKAKRRTRFALVPSDLISGYGVVSRGGDGHPGLPGQPGADGADGSDGSDAVCPNQSGTPGTDGGDGGPGGDGQPGGTGGDGGTIRVRFRCGSRLCPQLSDLTGIRSVGGKGGAGGAGGRGGRGGSGGDGGDHADCRSDEEKEAEKQSGFSRAISVLLGGPEASDGRDGSDGSDGRPGLAGRPGREGTVIDVTPSPSATHAAVAPVEVGTIFVLGARGMGDLRAELPGLYSERLLGGLQELTRFKGVGMRDLEALLNAEQQRDLLGCDDVSCIAEIAGAMNTDYLLRSTVGRVAGEHAVHLSLIDQKSTDVVSRADGFYATERELFDGVRLLLAKLLNER